MRCEMPQLSTVNEKQAQIHMMLLIENFSGYAVCVLLLSLKEQSQGQNGVRLRKSLQELYRW